MGNREIISLPSQGGFCTRMALDEWVRLRNDFTPSRCRFLPAIIATSAAAAQQSVEALPSFIPPGVSPEESLTIERTSAPFGRVPDKEFALHMMGLLTKVTEQQKLVKTSKRNLIMRLTSLAGQLRHLLTKLDSAVEPRAPVRSHNIPLISFLAQQLDYGDEELPRDLTKGVGITGPTPPTNVLACRRTPATTRLKALPMGLRTRNRAIPKSITNTRGHTIRSNCWEIVRNEHEKGRMSRPEPITDADHRKVVFPHRFCIS